LTLTDVRENHATSLTLLILYTRWFKYDRDDLCVNKSQFVPVIFEPPCIFHAVVFNTRVYFQQTAQYLSLAFLPVSATNRIHFQGATARQIVRLRKALHKSSNTVAPSGSPQFIAETFWSINTKYHAVRWK
jgi:hypothetical protein